MRIAVKAGDSPKIYALVRDIYGNPLEAEASDFTAFKYSVYKIVAGNRIAVPGFTDITIPAANYKKPPVDYPDNISGLSTSEIAEKYNVEVFPYIVENGAWKSPFTDYNSLYELAVNLVYSMEDPALTGTALIDKSFTVQVSVGAA